MIALGLNALEGWIIVRSLILIFSDEIESLLLNLRCEEILELHGLGLPMVCSKYLPILFSKDQETVRGFNRLPVQNNGGWIWC